MGKKEVVLSREGPYSTSSSTTFIFKALQRSVAMGTVSGRHASTPHGLPASSHCSMRVVSFTARNHYGNHLESGDASKSTVYRMSGVPLHFSDCSCWPTAVFFIYMTIDNDCL